MKRIETAASTEVELSSGRVLLIQEFTAFRAVTVMGKFRKILSVLRERNVLDLGSLRSEDGLLDLGKAVDWLDVILEIAENNYDELVDIICTSTVEEEDKNYHGLKKEDTENLSMGDVITLTQAVYKVNVEDGSLKQKLEFLTKKTETPAEDSSAQLTTVDA